MVFCISSKTKVEELEQELGKVKSELCSIDKKKFDLENQIKYERNKS